MTSGQLWVEARRTRQPPRGNAGNADGVTSIIIGSNDYAAAWATGRPTAEPLYAAVARRRAPARDCSYRAGINIVMYALTGNYKADQVHVPALLERLGQ